MENNLMKMTHPKFGTLSLITIDDKEMFKAKEIALMLGYKNINDAISRHCKGVVKHDLPTKSGIQEVNLIPESDVWRLIIRSKLPQAQEIEKWIMNDVLPTIRKTGSYKMQSATHNSPTVTAPYEYFDKTYGGQFVMTTDDLSQFLNVTRANVSEMIRKKLKIGTDYYFLEKTQLAWFKAQNPQVNKIAKHLIVVTRKGFDKLCNIYGVEVEKPKSFEIKPKPDDILERICKDNNITAIPLNDELRQMMRNMFRTDKSELEYVVELNGEKCIMYDDNATDLEKQCLVATGIAQIMNGRLNGEKKETTPEDVFAQVFTALSLFKQYSDKTP